MTNIACYWCCHSFDASLPCALPLSKNGDTYNVFGCFCSPECAASYNFYESEDSTEIWERYSLLNLLYKRIYSEKSLKIKLAPAKVIKMFGGDMSIKEFRDFNINYGRKIVVNMPPMISIIQQIEETNIDNKSKYIPLDDIRVQNADSNLRLKRKVPLTVSHNTLENCMSLKCV